MSFPTSPIDLQIAIVNGVTYQYSSSIVAWSRYSTTPISSTATSWNITQTAHGLLVGTWVYFDGTNWVPTNNTASNSVEAPLLISSVIDANTFIATSEGYITGLTGLTAGQTYFLSTLGAMSSTAPTVIGTYIKAVFRATSATAGYVIPQSTFAAGVTNSANLTILPWVTATSYILGDLVSVTTLPGVNQVILKATSAHTSGVTVNIANWELISQIDIPTLSVNAVYPKGLLVKTPRTIARVNTTFTVGSVLSDVDLINLDLVTQSWTIAYTDATYFLGGEKITEADGSVYERVTSGFSSGVDPTTDISLGGWRVISTAPVLKTTVNAKGDLLVATADNTITRIAVGSNGQTLVADSTVAEGVKWASGGLFKGVLATIAALVALPKAGLIDGETYVVEVDLYAWRPAASTGTIQPIDTVLPGVDSGYWVKVACQYAGTYSSTIGYEIGDLVLYQGKLFYAIASREAGVWGAAPSVSQFTQAPGIIKPQFDFSLSYVVGDIVYDNTLTIGLREGFYRCKVAHTGGNSPNLDSWVSISQSPIFRGNYGLGEYAVGDVVVNDNKLYTTTVANGSNNISGPFDETKFSPNVFPHASEWQPSVKVGTNEIRYFSISGINVFIKATAATTTGLTFDLTEAANWSYVGQISINNFVATTLTLPGLLISENGQLWQSISLRITSATFNSNEQDQWKRITSESSRVKVVTSNYNVTPDDDFLIVNATVTDVTITIPVTLPEGKKVIVHVGNVSGGNVIVESTALIITNGTLGTTETFTAQYSNIPYINAAGIIRIYS